MSDGCGSVEGGINREDVETLWGSLAVLEARDRFVRTPNTLHTTSTIAPHYLDHRPRPLNDNLGIAHVS